MTGRPILTAEAMRTAEQSAIDEGTSVETLMERAGAALAEAVYRFAGPMPALVLCGPGNNGGDGYVAARHLADDLNAHLRERAKQCLRRVKRDVCGLRLLAAVGGGHDARDRCIAGLNADCHLVHFDALQVLISE